MADWRFFKSVNTRLTALTIGTALNVATFLDKSVREVKMAGSRFWTAVKIVCASASDTGVGTAYHTGMLCGINIGYFDFFTFTSVVVCWITFTRFPESVLIPLHLLAY